MYPGVKLGLGSHRVTGGSTSLPQSRPDPSPASSRECAPESGWACHPDRAPGPGLLPLPHPLWVKGAGRQDGGRLGESCVFV